MKIDKLLSLACLARDFLVMNKKKVYDKLKKDDSEMSRDLIKPLLSSNKVYGINFKNNKVNIFKNTSFAVNFDGPQQYGQGFTDSDLWINNNKFGFGFSNLFSPATQFTAIYKYKVMAWNNYFIPNRNIAGIQPNLYATGAEFGVWNRGGEMV